MLTISSRRRTSWMPCSHSSKMKVHTVYSCSQFVFHEGEGGDCCVYLNHRSPKPLPLHICILQVIKDWGGGIPWERGYANSDYSLIPCLWYETQPPRKGLATFSNILGPHLILIVQQVTCCCVAGAQLLISCCKRKLNFLQFQKINLNEDRVFCAKPPDPLRWRVGSGHKTASSDDKRILC